VELLKQPQYQPYNVNDETLSIFAGANGFLDDLPVGEVPRFEQALLAHIRDEHPEVIDELDKTKDLSNDLAERVRGIIRNFKTHKKA
jgi:F-type H+-transporting ATPase subunit alpha